MASISISNRMSGPSRNSNRPHTNTSKGLSAMCLACWNQSNPSSFKLLLGWQCKASLSQARNTAFIINYLQLSQINGVNTAPLGGVPRPRFGAAAPRHPDAAHCSGVQHAYCPFQADSFTARWLGESCQHIIIDQMDILSGREFRVKRMPRLGPSRARGLKLRCEESIFFIRKQLDLPQVGCKKCFQVCMYVDRNAVGFSCKLL